MIHFTKVCRLKHSSSWTDLNWPKCVHSFPCMAVNFLSNTCSECVWDASVSAPDRWALLMRHICFPSFQLQCEPEQSFTAGVKARCQEKTAAGEIINNRIPLSWEVERNVHIESEDSFLIFSWILMNVMGVEQFSFLCPATGLSDCGSGSGVHTITDGKDVAQSETRQNRWIPTEVMTCKLGVRPGHRGQRPTEFPSGKLELRVSLWRLNGWR